RQPRLDIAWKCGTVQGLSRRARVHDQGGNGKPSSGGISDTQHPPGYGAKHRSNAMQGKLRDGRRAAIIERRKGLKRERSKVQWHPDEEVGREKNQPLWHYSTAVTSDSCRRWRSRTRSSPKRTSRLSAATRSDRSMPDFVTAARSTSIVVS